MKHDRCRIAENVGRNRTMRTMPKILLAVAVIAIIALTTSFSSERASAQTPCGPGQHWVDTCPAGDDDMPRTRAIISIDLTGNCVVDATLILDGPAKIHRNPGIPHEIQTEILEMTLTGSSPTLGDLTLRVGKNTAGINAAVPNTFGVIAEQPSSKKVTDSFFDVFFEIEIDPPGAPPPFKLYNDKEQPLRIEAKIDRVPPDVDYLHPSPLCLALLDAPNSGNAIGINIVKASHNTNPQVGGIAELPEVAGTPLEAPGSSGSNTGLIAGVLAAIAAGTVTLTGAAWYARRRWVR